MTYFGRSLTVEEVMREEKAAVAGPVETIDRYKVVIKEINGWFGRKQALKNINLKVKDKSVTAFIGALGCGKSSLIRCLNRMHEMTTGARGEGQLLGDGSDIYDNSIDPVVVKRVVG